MYRWLELMQVVGPVHGKYDPLWLDLIETAQPFWGAVLLRRRQAAGAQFLVVASPPALVTTRGSWRVSWGRSDEVNAREPDVSPLVCLDDRKDPAERVRRGPRRGLGEAEES